jgi:hypothetical protein
MWHTFTAHSRLPAVADRGAGQRTPTPRPAAAGLNRGPYGQDFVVDESLWEGVAVGAPLGIPGNGNRSRFRILYVFEIAPDGGIARKNVWMDFPAIIEH